MVRVKTVAAGADGRQVFVAAALHEIAWIGHAVLNREALFLAGARHVVEKLLAGADLAAESGRVSVDAIQPVLFVSNRTGTLQIICNMQSKKPAFYWDFHG